MPERIWSDRELDAELAAFRADVRPDAAALQRLRRRVLDDAAGGPGDAGADAAPTRLPERAAGPARSRSRWWAAAAAAAAVVATVSGVAVVGSGGTPPPASPAASPPTSPAAPPAAPVTPQATPSAVDPPLPDGSRIPAAELGRTATDPDVRPGQYLYRRTEHEAGPVVEEWIPADRSDVWLLRGSPNSEIGELTSRYGEYFGPRGDSWENPSQEFLAGLPRAPRALAALLRSDDVRSGAPYPDAPDHAALTSVASLLRSTAVPADLRAALFAALDHVPGVEAYVEDGGRRGVLRVDWDAAGEPLRYELLVDRATGRMSGQRTGTPGSGSTVTLGVADRLGVRPAG